MQPGKEPPTPATGCLTLGPHVARRWEGLALWVLSHTRVEGRGGRAGSGHLATLPGLRTARAAGALFLPPNQQLNCRGNIAASAWGTPLPRSEHSTGAPLWPSWLLPHQAGPPPAGWPLSGLPLSTHSGCLSGGRLPPTGE